VIKQTNAITSFTAGGLTTPVNWAVGGHSEPRPAVLRGLRHGQGHAVRSRPEQGSERLQLLPFIEHEGEPGLPGPGRHARAALAGSRHGRAGACQPGPGRRHFLVQYECKPRVSARGFGRSGREGRAACNRSSSSLGGQDLGDRNCGTQSSASRRERASRSVNQSTSSCSCGAQFAGDAGPSPWDCPHSHLEVVGRPEERVLAEWPGQPDAQLFLHLTSKQHHLGASFALTWPPGRSHRSGYHSRSLER
jgi:hypothetical protein